MWSPPPRPPTVHVGGERVRRDVDSEDVRRVHPDLPSTPAARLAHQAACDAAAYEQVRERFPALTPPRNG